MDHASEFSRKLVSPQEAVSVVKSGDWVRYGHHANSPVYLDGFLAKRKDELRDVKVCAVAFPGLAQVATCDPGREHFIYNNWHFGGGDRKLHDQGLCNYIPALYHEGRVYFERYLKLDVVMIEVAPMDKHGFFNFGTGNSLHATIFEGSKTVIVEVSDKMPYVYGGNEEAVHISDVDLIVESDNQPLVQVPNAEPTAVDNQVGEQGSGKVNVTVGD